MDLSWWMNHDESRAAEMKRILAREQTKPIFIRAKQSNPMGLISTHNLIANDPQLARRYLVAQEQEISHFEEMFRLLGDDKIHARWLVRDWPMFGGDLAKQILVLLTLSATICGARIEVSPEVVWEGPRTSFPHPRDVWWVRVVRSSTICARRYAHLPVPHSLRCCLRATLLGGQMMLLP